MSKCCSPPAQVRASRLPGRVNGVATYPFPSGEHGAEIMAVHWEQADGRDYPVTNYVLRRTAYRDEVYEGDETMLLHDRSDESAWDMDPSFKYRLTSNGRVEYSDSRAVVDPEITYAYELKAVSAIGRSSLWSELVFSLEDYRPAQITEMSAADGGASHVRMDWTQPDGHGSPIDGYEIAVRYGYHGNYYPQRGRRSVEDTTHLTEPMPAGAIAYLKVRAVNCYGPGPWSDPVTFRIPGIAVEPEWEGVPPGLNPGDSFRLLFVKSGRRDATTGDITEYNGHVAEHAGRNEHPAPHAERLRSLAATRSVNARDNTETEPNYGGTPLYWVGGDRVADDYADLYDGAWRGGEPKNEQGETVPGDAEHVQVWTGAEFDGLRYQDFALGSVPGPGRPGPGRRLRRGNQRPEPQERPGTSAVRAVARVHHRNAACRARSGLTAALAAPAMAPARAGDNDQGRPGPHQFKEQ